MIAAAAAKAPPLTVACGMGYPDVVAWLVFAEGADVEKVNNVNFLGCGNIPSYADHDRQA